MFKLNDIEYDFKRVCVADAIEIQKLMLKASAKDGDLDLGKIGEALGDLTPFALKYVKLKNKDGTWLENADTETLEHFFENPFFALEITKNFFEVIQGFLASLPSFQKAQKAKV